MAERKIKAITLNGATLSVTLPCGVVWFTVANSDANISSSYKINFNDGDEITKVDVAFATPENMPYLSTTAPNDIKITWIAGGSVDVVWIQ